MGVWCLRIPSLTRLPRPSLALTSSILHSSLALQPLIPIPTHVEQVILSLNIAYGIAQFLRWILRIAGVTPYGLLLGVGIPAVAVLTIRSECFTLIIACCRCFRAPWKTRFARAGCRLAATVC